MYKEKNVLVTPLHKENHWLYTDDYPYRYPLIKIKQIHTFTEKAPQQYGIL